MYFDDIKIGMTVDIPPTVIEKESDQQRGQ